MGQLTAGTYCEGAGAVLTDRWAAIRKKWRNEGNGY